MDKTRRFSEARPEEVKQAPIRPKITTDYAGIKEEQKLEAFVGGFGDEETEEARKPKGLRMPSRPGQTEVDEHNLNHCPFRAWCAHCVAGKAVSDGHYHSGETEDGVPIISIDYMYLTEEGQEE